jgi:hypothetical protein
MPLDREISQANRDATARIRALAERSSDEQLETPVGEHWTVGVVFAHLAFWDRRVLDVLDRAARDGRVEELVIDVVANDLSLPLWRAIPGQEAARIAIEAAEALDEALEAADDATLAAMAAITPRWVRRHVHRNEHLDEAEAALAGSGAPG